MESRYERRLAKVQSLQMADAYVLVRADCPDGMQPYVYLADEIVSAPVIREARADYPFTRDPGVRNPAQAGFWVRKGWSFCDPKRLGAWHLLRKCEVQCVAAFHSLPKPERTGERRRTSQNAAPAIAPETRNGIRAPKLGGLCDQAWRACGVLAADLERLPRRAEAVDYAISLGLNAGNMRTEYGYWRRFYCLMP